MMPDGPRRPLAIPSVHGGVALLAQVDGVTVRIELRRVDADQLAWEIGKALKATLCHCIASASTGAHFVDDHEPNG